MATRAKETHKDLPVVTCASQRTWNNWLARNHAKVDAVWVKFAKKASKKKTVSYIEARDTAIAWGWIDGLINAYDDDYSVRRFTPRRKRSKWSQINRDVAEQLIADGLMQAPGLEQVEAAKADGRWAAAYPSASKITEPADFKKALRANKKAAAFYKTISKTNRFAILVNIHDAVRPATRQRRIDKYVAMLAAGDVPHPGR